MLPLLCSTLFFSTSILSYLFYTEYFHFRLENIGFVASKMISLNLFPDISTSHLSQITFYLVDNNYVDFEIIGLPPFIVIHLSRLSFTAYDYVYFCCCQLLIYGRAAGR